MGVYTSADVAFFLIEQFNVLGVTTRLRDKKSAVTEDTTVLGNNWRQHGYTELNRYEAEQAGFFDDAAASVNAALVGGPGTPRIVSFGYATNAKGKPFTGFGGAMQIDYERVAERGALHKANASYLGNGQVDEGRIVHELAAETATSGNTDAASVDNGAASANGGAAYIHLTSLTLGGFSNVSIQLRHSTDNITFADMSGIVATTNGVGAYRIAISGTINRYVSMRWSYGGAGAGQSFTAMVGIARN